VIYEKTPGYVAELADVYEALYEMSAENGKMEDAFKDIDKCIELRKQILPSHHRDIAAACYSKAMGLFNANRKEESLENYKITAKILTAFITACTADQSKQKEEVQSVLESVKQVMKELDFSINTPIPTNATTPRLGGAGENASFATPVLPATGVVNNLGMVGTSTKRIAPTTEPPINLPVTGEKRKGSFDNEESIERREKLGNSNEPSI